MECFSLNKEFDDFESVLAAKKLYERATNSILVIEGSKPLIGDGELKTKLVYERLLYGCKAGAERPSSSNGLRASSTYKKGCPVKIRLALVKNKLTVKDIKLTHENHNLDEATYNHYPENMKIDNEQLKTVEKMIEVGGNKHKIKADLMKNEKKVVALKTLHNIQTKQLKEKQGSNDVDSMEKLLQKLQQVPNARIRVVTNEKLELIGIYFQDERMSQIFEKYPELMLYDATYKMNNRDMPLITQMCVDGNGETEICSIFFARSESYMSVGSMVDIFISLNPAWTKTKVILGDKDFADRGIYSTKYPNAVLQICLYHVLVAFNREITTTKRDITTAQRNKVLEMLQRLAYSESKQSYDAIYNELLELQLEKVIDYYNVNWHGIRDEWTQFGRNAYANYLNSTNNRTESINQKFKIVSNRHANLLTFFENIFTTVSVLASERNIRAVKMTMRVPRQRFTDECLAKYNDFLTPFVFKKLEYQMELSSALIKFSVVTDDRATTAKTNGNGHFVTEQHCTCLYFSSMEIPCRHLLQFLATKNLDLFQPGLCAKRWTKAYYYESHPAINSIQYVPPQLPVHVVRVRIPSEMEKYKKTATLTKDINNMVLNMSNSQFQYFFGKMQDIRAEIVGESTNLSEEPVAGSSNIREMTSSAVQRSLQDHEIPQNSQLLTVPVSHQQENVRSVQDNLSGELISHRQENIVHRNNSQPSTSTDTLQLITLPTKVISIGRPKGSGNTVIGTKRKTTTNSQTSQSSTPSKKMKFLERNFKDQGVLIATWLTNWPVNRIGAKKITIGDIVQDPHTFNRLRHKDVDLNCIKKFTDKNTFNYITDEVERLNKRPYICRKCQRILNGVQIMCHGCLDWYHEKCIQTKGRNIAYFCADC